MKLAVIPARGGSKRIPRKNIRPFCGKPIIAWSIAAARQSGCFDRVIVSTDDLSVRADVASPTTKGKAQQVLKEYLASRPAERDTLQVVPVHELEAA